MNLAETKSKAREILSSWALLCEYLMVLDEKSTLYLMNRELKEQAPRTSIIKRCYSRYSYLRSQRERKQLDDYTRNYIRMGVIHGKPSSFEKITKFESTQPGNDRL